MFWKEKTLSYNQRNMVSDQTVSEKLSTLSLYLAVLQIRRGNRGNLETIFFFGPKDYIL